jgi:hypothetical protein
MKTKSLSLIQDSNKWCSKCGMILSFAGYQQVLKEQEEKDKELAEMKATIQQQQQRALEFVMNKINAQVLKDDSSSSKVYVNERNEPTKLK